MEGKKEYRLVGNLIFKLLYQYQYKQRMKLIDKPNANFP